MQCNHPTFVFVYGTLKVREGDSSSFVKPPLPNAIFFPFICLFMAPKRGFGNHHVLKSSRFVGPATTTDSFPLFCDHYRVPYLVDTPGIGHQITGELFSVTPLVLAELDKLEGVNLGRYLRQQIRVETQQTGVQLPDTVWAYILPLKPALGLENRTLIDEYTLEIHSAGFVFPAERDQSRRRSWGGFD